MVESTGPRADEQSERRASVRRSAAQAAHTLIEALTTADAVTFTELVGEADVHIQRAREELLRGQI